MKALIEIIKRYARICETDDVGHIEDEGEDDDRDIPIRLGAVSIPSAVDRS